MDDWKKIPIGELFTLEKGLLQSTKCTPGEFTFITASNDWKTHTEYTHDCEALIYAVAASGSLGRCHYFKGKFISSDLCFILQAKDKKKYPINYKFYQNIFVSLKKDIVMRTKAGTSKESISQKRFSEYKIPYFGINHQNIWEEKLNILNKEIENFSFENSIQFGILTRIRQSILQEAIEGKLTANWRQDNPIRKGDPEYDGAALLKKIKAEKQKMIGEGKIRKEKPIAPIKPDDVPFALPEGWVWTRLGETGNLKRGKSKHRPRNDVMLFKNGTYPFIQTGNVSDAKFNKDLIVSTNNFYNEFGLKQSEMQKKGTLCITIAANIAECGFLNFDACIPDSIVCFASINRVIDKYVYYFIKTAKANLEKFAPATAQKNINLGILGILPIPLPPLAEQRVIVDKVEKLFTMVDALELQTKERKEQAERLVRAVLREAFEK